jgi:hypothetical protein
VLTLVKCSAKYPSTDAVRNEAQAGGVDKPNIASINADQLHLLKLGKLATQGLCADAEIARDVFARHRQPKPILRRVWPVQAGVYVDQKCGDPLHGTESRSAHTLPREFAAHQAPDPGVQALKLRAQSIDLYEWHDTQGGRFEDLSVAAMLIGIGRVEAEQFTAQMEAVYELVTARVDTATLDAAVAHGVDGGKLIANPEQDATRGQCVTAPDDRPQASQGLWIEARRPAKLVERTEATGMANLARHRWNRVSVCIHLSKFQAN